MEKETYILGVDQQKEEILQAVDIISLDSDGLSPPR